MASTESVTVEIRADTSQFDSAMQGIQRRLWWFRYGATVIAVAGMALTFGGGFLLGLAF